MTESRVYLQEAAAGQLVEASGFDEVTDEHLALWESEWVPAMKTYCSGTCPTKRLRMPTGTGGEKSVLGGNC